MKLTNLWGEGLSSRHYFRGAVSLRRNGFVHEVILSVWRCRCTFVLYSRR